MDKIRRGQPSPRLRVSSNSAMVLTSSWQDIQFSNSTTGVGSSLNTNEYDSGKFLNSVTAYDEANDKLTFSGSKTLNYRISLGLRFSAAATASNPSLLGLILGWMGDNSIDIQLRFKVGSFEFPFPDSQQYITLGTIAPNKSEIDRQFGYTIYANDDVKTDGIKIQIRANRIDRVPQLTEAILLVFPG